METASIIIGEVVFSTATTTAVATSVNAEPLLTALIGFGVSLVTMVGGELVKFLVAFFKKKTKDLQEPEGKQDKDKKE